MATNITPPEPLSPIGSTDADSAADIIRDKLARIYQEEPSALSERQEADAITHRSKHQQFMHELSTSGKDLATIQTQWHEYYQSLPAAEQHQVWQEFYDSQSILTKQPTITSAAVTNPQTIAEHKHQASTPKPTVSKAPKLRDVRSAKEVQNVIRHTVSSGGKLQTKHHLQSLFFGLGMGLIVIIIFLFGFFNEVIIAPFVQPSRVASATPLIVSSSSVAPTANPEVIIPKINVEIPVNYDQTSTDESVIENDLESGVVHYPTTALPGQVGNTALFGHSSNNIFNKGKYKFAFVLLHTLVPGDTFYLTYQSKVYVYKVITKTVVEPTEVSVLDPVAGQTATATLITCDPPGTSLKRLVIVGQQISPDPSGNQTATTLASSTTASPDSLPGNGQTLFGKFFTSTVGKVVVGGVVFIAFIATIRWINKPKHHRK